MGAPTSQTESESVRKIFSLLSEWSALVDTLETTLKVLNKDLILTAKGWKIHYAVDFAEVYAFAHKSLGKPIVEAIPGEDSETRFVRGQISLAYVFSPEFSPLVLLPPYLLELKDHINHIRGWIGGNAVNVEMQTLRNSVEKSLRDSDLYDEVIMIAKKESAGETIGRSDYRTIARFVAGYLKDIYAWVAMAEAGKATSVITDLIKTGKLQPASDYFTGIDYPLEKIVERGEEFYDIIFSERGHARSYQSYMDGLACSYVEYLNSRLNSRRECLVLIAHSIYAQRAMDKADAIELGGDIGKLPYIRDMDYFLTYLTHSEASSDEVPRGIAKSMEVLTNFKQIQDQDRISVEASAILAHAERLISALKLRINSKENLDVALGQKGKHLLDHARNIQLVSSTIEDRLARFVLRVLADDKRVVEEIRTETDRVREEIAESSRALYELFRVGYLSTSELETISRYSKSQTPHQVLLRGFGGEPPVRLSFKHPDVREFARLFDRVGDVEGARDLKQKLIEIASEPSPDLPEIHLLLAYVMCSLGDWEIALAELDRGLSMLQAVDGERREFLFLRCLVLRRLSRLEDALASCLEGLCKWPNAAVFNREMAVIIWQSLGKEEEKKRISLKLGQIASLDVAISYALQALKDRRTDPFLRAQVLNTLAYLHAERGRRIDIARAEKYLKGLSEAISEKDWVGRFYDTRGFIYLVLAKTKAARADRNLLLQQAVRDFQMALRDKEMVADERKIVQKHSTDAQTLLHTV